MSAPTRLIAIAIGLLLFAAPDAHAATTTAFDVPSRTVTLTNGAEGETFAITLSFDSVEPTTGYEYRVTSGGAIPLGSSPCENMDGGKTIFCDAADNVDGFDIVGGDGADAFTVSSATPNSGGASLAIRAGLGNDTFTAGAGGSLNGSALKGEAGDDTYNGSDVFADYFVAEPGNDTYRGGSAPIPAGVDPDGFQRQSASDQWSPVGETPINVSLDGVANDADGQGGTDNVADVESIEATNGNDTLAAGATGVFFSSGTGDDTVIGSPQADLLYGEEGNDTVRGLGGDDFLSDGDGDDPFRLNSDPAVVVGNDALDGGGGDDDITWGAGKDDILGGAGTDTATTARLAIQSFDTAVPDDAIAKAEPLTISLNDLADDGPTGGSEGDNIHADVENVTVDTANLMWSVRSTRIAFGGALPAANTITGSPAANVITTSAGNDIIDAGTGADTVNSGAGDDVINAVDKTTDTLHCGRGTDTVGADLAGTNAARADVLTDCETVSGTALGLEGGALPVAPKVTLGGATGYKVKKFLRTYTVTTDVTTDQSATVSGELSTTGAKIAKVGALTVGSGALKAGLGKRKLKVAVRVKYRKALKRKLKTKKQRRKGIKLSLAVTVFNGAGQVTTSTRSIRVKG